MIEKLPGSDVYGSYAYDIAVLKYFVGARNGGGWQVQSKSKMRRSSSRVVLGRIVQGIDSSIHSVGTRVRMSLDWSHSSTSSGGRIRRPVSMDGTNHSFNTKKMAQFNCSTTSPPLF